MTGALIFGTCPLCHQAVTPDGLAATLTPARRHPARLVQDGGVLRLTPTCTIP